jgi:hemolysin-activating ACP:hemolysin acyltransferase
MRPNLADSLCQNVLNLSLHETETSNETSAHAVRVNDHDTSLDFQHNIMCKRKMLFALDQVLRQTNMQVDDDALLALRLGLVAELSERHRGKQSLDRFVKTLVPSIDTGKCYFGFDQLMRLVGYVVWATVSHHSDVDVASESQLPLDENRRHYVEVENFWLVDFHCQPRGARPIIYSVLLSALNDPALNDPALNDALLNDACEIHYQRSRQGRQRPRKLMANSVGKLRRHALNASEPDVTLTARRDLIHTRELAFKRTINVGRFLRLLAESSDWRQLSLTDAIRKARRALDNGQVKFYFDADQRAIGLLSWAWLSKRTIERVSTLPLHAVHDSELNEGDTLCLVDILAPAMAHRELLDDVARDLFPAEPNVLQYVEPTQNRPATFRAWLASERNMILETLRNTSPHQPNKTTS